MKVNLKWSLWSKDQDTWEEYAPGVLKQIKEIVESGEFATVHTAPSREIRYGTVVIWKTLDVFRANVVFDEEWDPVESNISCMTQGRCLTTKQTQHLIDTAPMTADGTPGVTESGEVEALTLDELWGLIDAVEDALIRKSREKSDQWQKEADL